MNKLLENFIKEITTEFEKWESVGGDSSPSVSLSLALNQYLNPITYIYMSTEPSGRPRYHIDVAAEGLREKLKNESEE